MARVNAAAQNSAAGQQAPFDHNILLLGVPEPAPPPAALPSRTKTPTDQQLAIVADAKNPHPTKCRAFAGAGKTSTCELFAQKRGDKGLYLAFSRPVALEAAARFPRNIRSETIHALALGFSGLGAEFERTGKKIGNPTPLMICQTLALKGGESAQLAWFLRETVNAYCASADPALQACHIPQVVLKVIEGKAKKSTSDPIKVHHAIGQELSRVVSLSKSLWEAMINLGDRSITISHDAYLKLWALSEPQFGPGFILLDEAQDCSPLMCELIARQQTKLLLVGDPHQSIYGFRGAVSAMDRIDGNTFDLTRSFRFGPVIEMVANAILSLKGETTYLQGASKHEGVIHEPSMGLEEFMREGPCTALVRTNAEALLIASQHLRKRPVAILGGVAEMVRMATSAHALRHGRVDQVGHHLLKPFAGWDQLLSYADSTTDQDIRRIIQLVEDHGSNLPNLVSDLQTRLVGDDRAALIVGTTHKAKGKEWDNVYMADDFAELFNSDGKVTYSHEELNLLYVNATRSRRQLRMNHAASQALNPP